jgi:hypothetical protein
MGPYAVINTCPIAGPKVTIIQTIVSEHVCSPAVRSSQRGTGTLQVGKKVRLSIRRRRDICTSLLVPRICVQRHTRQNRAPCHACFGKQIHASFPLPMREGICALSSPSSSAIPLHIVHDHPDPQIISSIIQSRAELIYWARGENNLHKLSDMCSLLDSLSLRCPDLMRLGLGLLRV